MDNIKITNSNININETGVQIGGNFVKGMDQIKQPKTEELNLSVENSDKVPEYVNGVDVSSWQQDVDYKQLSKYAKFVMIRMANGYETDTYFDKNFRGATDAGIPTGIYFASNATTVEEFHKEADFMIEKLSKYPKNKTTFPIFLDFENKRKYLENEATRVEINNGIREYFKTMEEAGYTPGLYIHVAVIEYIDEDIKKNYPIWLIDGKDYNDEIDITQIDGDNVDKKYVDQLGKDTFMVQVSQGGQGENVGVQNGGNIDVDFMNGETYKKWVDAHDDKIKSGNMADGHSIYK